MIEKHTKVTICETKVLEYFNDYKSLYKKKDCKLNYTNLRLKIKNPESLFFFQIVVTSRDPHGPV